MTPIILHYKDAPSTLIPDACTPTGRGWEQPSDAASAHSQRVFFGEAAGAPHPYGLPSQQTPASSRNKGARGPRARLSSRGRAGGGAVVKHLKFPSPGRLGSGPGCLS